MQNSMLEQDLLAAAWDPEEGELAVGEVLLLSVAFRGTLVGGNGWRSKSSELSVRHFLGRPYTLKAYIPASTSSLVGAAVSTAPPPPVLDLQAWEVWTRRAISIMAARTTRCDAILALRIPDGMRTSTQSLLWLWRRFYQRRAHSFNPSFRSTGRKTS